MTPETFDCVIVGGGAAGLMAAVYFGRYRRRTIVVDAGASRLAMIPKSRNVPGFPDGIAGAELLERLRAQAAQYDVPHETACVDEIRLEAAGGFTVRAGERVWRAKFVLLATGAKDVQPELPGLDVGLQHGHVRYCPVCDGFETQGQRVAVLGRGSHGLRESIFVAGFRNQVTWLALQTQDDVEPPDLQSLRDAGVSICEAIPSHIRCVPGVGVHVELRGGEVMTFDVLYPALGLAHASELATRLGAQTQPDGQLVVDDHMQTTVPGLYAAGDVAVDLNQISVAAGHAAIAATAIHNRL